MTTLVVKLSPALAIELARAADDMKLEHAEVATLALRLFLRAKAPPTAKPTRLRRLGPARRTGSR